MQLIFSSWLALLSKNYILPFFFFFRDWIVGDVMCKIFPLLFYGNTAATLFNIAAVTMNRWHEFIFNKYQLLTSHFHEFLISNFEFFIYDDFFAANPNKFCLIICCCFFVETIKNRKKSDFRIFEIGNSWNHVVSNSVVVKSCNFD